MGKLIPIGDLIMGLALAAVLLAVLWALIKNRNDDDDFGGYT